jgi:RNA polymerase sigma factor (sigma-70 family)
MPPPALAPALRHLHRLLARPDAGDVDDGQLLRRFVAHGDQAAFELLVWRHGPMVLGLCRRVLRDRHEAEDAFQATFLVLARRAAAIARPGSVGSWLYKVAYRVALRERAGQRRRDRFERPAAELLLADRHAVDPERGELRAVIDEELARLPDKYRAPVVLCYLEGRTNEEAARQLGSPTGTIKTRLARARRLLADRLARRGLAPWGRFSNLPAVAVPAALAGSTARAAALAAAGKTAAAGAVSAHVAGLTEGVLRAMMLTKLKVAAVVMAVGLAVGGAGMMSYRALAAGPADDAASRAARLRKQIENLQEELRQAERDAQREKEAAARDKPGRPAPKAPPVAVIFDDVPITREELGDYLLRRVTREQLDGYIRHRILEHACRERGITVTGSEVDAAFEAERKRFADPAAFEAMLRERGKSPPEWKADVIRPRLLLRKLCRDRVRVTERDLRNAFEAAYGEKVECRMILWPPDQRDQAVRTAKAFASGDGARFDLTAANQPNERLARADGRIPPIGRHATGEEALERAAFRLQPGQISPLVETAEGYAVLKCLRRIPPDETKEYEGVREQLERQVRERLTEKEIKKVFQELKEQAHPRVLWKPDA